MLLDLATLKGLAKLIERPPNILGSQYRTNAEVLHFFMSAGATRQESKELDSCLRYGNKRILLSLLIRISNRGEIDKVVLRLASPLEYGGDESRWKLALESLNRLLKYEGFKVEFDGIKPVITEIKPSVPSITNETSPASSALAIDLPEQIAGDLLPTFRLLNAEYQQCLNAGAFLASVVLLGAVLEAALFSAHKKHHEKQGGSEKPYENWSLSKMIDVACKQGWIGSDVRRLDDIMRDYRNLIHPRKLMQETNKPDEDTVKACAHILQINLRKLSEAGLLG